MRFAVIDIGSNSIKLTIGEAEGNDIRILESLKNISPIGVDTFFRGNISQGVIRQVIGFLERYKDVINEYDVEQTTVIATTAVREASNRDIFIDTVLRKTGLKVEVLTTGDVVYYINSYLSYMLKSKYPIQNKNLLIAELGSGSLDVSVVEKDLALFNIGLPLGTLRMKRLMGKLTGSSEEVNGAVREYIDGEFRFLKRSVPDIKIDDIILIDENYSSYIINILPSMKKQERFFSLTQRDSKKLLGRLSGKSEEDIAFTYNIPAEFADTITAYSMILNLLFAVTMTKNIYIFEASLSEAILTNRLFDTELSIKYSKLNQLISVAYFFCKKYNVDLEHARQVAKISETLFKGLKGQLGLEDSEFVYLMLASYLHDVGMLIHNRSHHKHTEYIINSQQLFRLTDDEIKMIAGTARYHRKATPKRNHFIYSSLPHDKQILVQKLSAILRISDSLDASHRQKVKRLEVKAGDGRDVTLTVHTDDNFILEKLSFAEKKTFLEEISGSRINLVIKT